MEIDDVSAGHDPLPDPVSIPTEAGGTARNLHCRPNRWSPEGAGEFERTAPGLSLGVIDLMRNVLKNLEAQSIAMVPCPRELEALCRDRTEITFAGVRLFADRASCRSTRGRASRERRCRCRSATGIAAGASSTPQATPATLSSFGDRAIGSKRPIRTPRLRR